MDSKIGVSGERRVNVVMPSLNLPRPQLTVASLHPENIAVDPRLDQKGSEWRVIWEQAKGGHGPEGSSCGCWEQVRGVSVIS